MIAYAFSALLAAVIMFGPAAVLGGIRLRRQEVRRRKLRSPDTCRFCYASGGWHQQGCSRLHRLDRGMRS